MAITENSIDRKFIDLKGFDGLYGINKLGEIISYKNKIHKIKRII